MRSHINILPWLLAVLVPMIAGLPTPGRAQDQPPAPARADQALPQRPGPATPQTTTQAPSATQAAGPATTGAQAATSQSPGGTTAAALPPVSERPFGTDLIVLPVDHLLGDWYGLRTRLEDQGITPSLTFESDLAGNPVGGIRHGFTEADNLGFDVHFDLDKLYGLQGGTFVDRKSVV